MKLLLSKIKACNECKIHLPFGPNPIVSASPKSKLIIIGQAPGLKVHTTGIPWNDKSGDNLRQWLGLSKELFYDPDRIALIPMGFCYPGKSKNGDLPPRTECAPLWHRKLLSQIKDAKLTLLIGKYAQDYYLGNHSFATLSDNVRQFKGFLPVFFPLPHPSPRNNIWRSKNPWFEKAIIPELQKKILHILK